MQTFTLHTHSIYSDGKSTPVEMIEEAIKQKLTMIGFSEHSPLPFENNFSLKAAWDYVEDVKEHAVTFADEIKIKCGLEADYIPAVTQPFAETRKYYGLDYVIGGVHLVGKSANPDEIWFIDGPKYEVYDEGLQKFFDCDIRRAVKAFYQQTNEMIENEQFDIIAHFDKIKMHNRNRYFTEDEKWYRDLAFETLGLIAEKGLIMEINTRGIYKKRCPDLYPSPWLIKEARKKNIPVMISSDAHHCSELTLEFATAANALLEAGYKSVTAVENGIRQEYPIE